MAASMNFCPPLWQQRYTAAVQMLEDRAVKSVVDFGCAECKLIPLVRRISSVEDLAGVDIDRPLLEARKCTLRPLIADYLCPRDRPLRVRLFEGSVSTYDPRLDGFQAVTMVEVIEHLTPDVLTALPAVLFGELRPQYVFITTPNAEFNVLFPNFSGMRHDDHKFEWTRVEFQTWCSAVCSEFPYDVEYGGVGEPPPDRAEVGPCSQTATFTRRAAAARPAHHPDTGPQVAPYSLVTEEVYPHRERLADDAALLMEAEYYMRRLAVDDSSHQDSNGEMCHVSLEDLLAYRSVGTLCPDVSKLRCVLKEAGYCLTEDGAAVLIHSSVDTDTDDDDSRDDDPEGTGSGDMAVGEPEQGRGSSSDTTEERWTDDAEDEGTSHIVPYMDMWADAEGQEMPAAQVDQHCSPRLDLPPPNSDIEPEMVYVPSSLHAPPSLSVAARGAPRREVRPGRPAHLTSHSLYKPSTNLVSVEPGQFDDVTLCSNSEQSAFHSYTGLS